MYGIKVSGPDFGLGVCGNRVQGVGYLPTYILWAGARPF